MYECLGVHVCVYGCMSAGVRVLERKRKSEREREREREREWSNFITFFLTSVSLPNDITRSQFMSPIEESLLMIRNYP